MSIERVLSLSYGKDSIACIPACEQLGWKIDRAVHVEIMATPTIPADLPPMMEFKKKADEIILERYGIKVEHLHAPMSYDEYFHCIFQKGKNKGRIYGFPMQRGAWCNSRLKMSVLGKLDKADIIQYIGIAADEPARFHNITERKLSPLVEAGWDEAVCRKWCDENGLLSPIYTKATRGGCWFCHNQGVDQLRQLRMDYPEYWKLMLKWDAESPITFKNGGLTVHDYDTRFSLEQDGWVEIDSGFRWFHIQNPSKQMSFDEYTGQATKK